MKRFLSLILALALAAGLCGTVVPVQASTGGKLIALTFDDGPGPYTERLLDGLKERGVKVTFFLVGNRINRYAKTVARAYQEGHQIANHSYDHSNLVNLSNAGIQSQIRRTNALLDPICGAGSDYLVRAPYGSTNARVRAAVGAPLVFWSVDPLDWRDRNAATVKSRVINGARDGAIILLHDIHSTSVTGALAAIDVLLGQGYEFVTVRELFRRRGVAMANGVSYSSRGPTGTDLGPVTAPGFSDEAVDGKLKITLTAQPGASIYYSLDGPSLNQASTLYTGPFTVSTPCTVWAVAAYDMNGSRSGVAEKTFTYPTAKSPAIRISDGVLTLESRTEGTEVYYTLRTASSPAGEEQPYTGPVPLTPGTEVAARAAGDGYYDSPVSRAVYSARGNFFLDVFPASWFYDAVDQAVQAGWTADIADERFLPDQMTTRAELTAMLYRCSGETVTQAEIDACPFRDLAADGIFRDAVCWACARGIVNGYAGLFRLNDPISRQEMSKVVTLFLACRGKQVPDGAGLAQNYRDAGAIASWAAPYVEAATACGLLQGSGGNFRPEGRTTRAEAVTVLVRLTETEGRLPDLP